MAEFIYLFRSDEPRQASEVLSHMDEWLAWLKELDEKGHLKEAGKPFEPAGKVVKGAAKTVTDGYAGANNIVDGYMLIEASDMAEAVELAKGCPILAHEGLVEVRPVMKLEF